MKKAFFAFIFLAAGIVFAFFALRSVDAQISGCGCTGPIYCTGPCDTLWFPPNNCGCEATLCDFFDGVAISQSECEGVGGCGGIWNGYTCDSCFLCSSSACTGTCPAFINPCINVCDGGGGNGGGNGNGGPTPSCTVDLAPSTASVSVGSPLSLIASVVPSDGTVDRVDFVSDNETVVTVNPISDSSSPYMTDATGQTLGSANVVAAVIMGGANRCTDTSAINVTNPGPWWQIQDADIITNGNLISSIPTTCTLPSCNPTFDLDGAGGYPGVPSYGGTTADFAAGAGTGTVSSTGWLASTFSSFKKTYDYSFFERLIPADVTFTELDSPSVNGGFFASGGTQSRGYVWYHFDGATLGDLTINTNVNLPGDRKVILLVEGADLYIQGRINLVDGRGFLMTIVGKDASGLKGDIFVDAGVSHPTQVELEGIFLAEGQFRTGAGSNQLHIRGAVAAYDGVVLERDLSDNSDEPAEVFEYAPDLIFTFPRDLSTKRLRWKEVAP